MRGEHDQGSGPDVRRGNLRPQVAVADVIDHLHKRKNLVHVPAEARHDDFLYQAASWDKPRRVVAKVEWHKGELLLRVGVITTNQFCSNRCVVKFYNGR